MATIQTAISLTDGMTPALRSISSALNTVMRNFASLQQTSSNSINTANITSAQRALAGTNTHITNMGNNLGQANNQQNNLNQRMREGSSIASGLANKIGGMVAAYAGMETAMGLIKATDSYTNISSRLDLINDGLQTTEELQEMVRESANSTFSNYKDTADMVGKLGIQAADAFANNQDIINFSEQINKHLAIAGTSGAAAQGAMVQLTQAMSNGVLRGEELNSVMDGMPTVVKAIEKEFAAMGDNRAIKQIAEDGLISADIVKRALYNAADETNAKFDKMGVTFADVWNLFQNNADKAMKPVYEQLKKLTNTEDFQNFAVKAGQAVGLIASALVGLFGLIVGVGTFISDNWSFIAPILAAVTAAFLLQGAAALWSRRQILLNALATAWKTICDWAATAAIIAMEFAQYGLNAALAMCPLTWIIGLIIVLIAVFYLAVAAVNYFAGTSISATGIIAGLFMVLYSTIYNIVAKWLNIFASLAEFLANVFRHPIFSIKALFVNLLNTVLDVCISITQGWDSMATSFANSIIKAVNIAIGAWNSFVDILPDKVKATLGIGKGTAISETTSITSDLQGIKGGLKDWLGDAPSDYWEAPKMEMKSVGGAWDTGYKWGQELAEKASLKNLKEENKDDKDKNAAELLKNAGLGAGSPANDIADKAGKTAGNTGKTADSTSKMADSLKVNEEDIKLLREIAQRETINRFTTAEIKIDMKNNNSISNGMDIDGVVNLLTDKLYNAMSIAAEGVHI